MRMEAFAPRERMLRILFVDDDNQILKIIQRLLRSERERWQMTFVQTPHAAIDRLRRELFDIVVTDLVMPSPGGRGVLAAAHAYLPAAKRVVLTGAMPDPTSLDAHLVIDKNDMRRELRERLAGIAV
jgi:CheY-like chemotaxis protein